jgi:hypothetical protein
VIGRVGGDELVIEGRLELGISELEAARAGGLERALGTPLLG